MPRTLWIAVFIVVACGCDHLVGEQTWYEKEGWKAADFFTDTTAIALCDAIAANDLDGIKKSIAAGTDVDARGKGNMTPLLWAFVDNKPERFRLLLEAGAGKKVPTRTAVSEPRANGALEA